MEAKPILEPGLNDLALSDLEMYFLSSFPESTTRPALIEGLKAYLAHLKSLGVQIELWVDGSFVTTKLNPSDVDLVLFAPAAGLDTLEPQKQEAFSALVDRATIKQYFGCDVLFCPSENQNMRSYWRGWYGFDRNEQPKGIARLMVAT